MNKMFPIISALFKLHSDKYREYKNTIKAGHLPTYSDEEMKNKNRIREQIDRIKELKIKWLQVLASKSKEEEDLFIYECSTFLLKN